MHKCDTISQSEHIWCIIYSCGDQWDFTGGVASMIDRMSCVTYDGGLKYLYFVEITNLVRKCYSFWPSVEKDAFCIHYSWVTASTEKPAKTYKITFHFHCMKNCSLSILLNISFCVPQMKDVVKVWSDVMVSNCKSFNFTVIFFFNLMLSYWCI